MTAACGSDRRPHLARSPTRKNSTQAIKAATRSVSYVLSPDTDLPARKRNGRSDSGFWKKFSAGGVVMTKTVFHSTQCSSKKPALCGRSFGFALICLLVCSALAGNASRATAQSLPTPSEMIWIRTTDKTPDQVVDAIKAYIEQKKWISFGATTITPPQGRLTIVKFCIPLVGRQLYALSLQLAALLPCGNLGVYTN
jgi:hypothetical protein